jgi:putative ABC transport system substrate-binding protein
MRRVGVLTNLAADDPEAQARVGAFLQGLQEFGWAVGRNVRIDYRWGGGDGDRTRRYAQELVALTPDVILTSGSTALAPLLQATRGVPIVFSQVPDPVGAGFVKSLARPGGNATGFITFEYGLSGKWLELLKEIAPGVTRAAVLRDPTQSAGIGQWGAIQAVAPSLILAAGTEAALAAQRATSVIPIVFPLAADPVGSGLVASLSRPGGNITGLSNLASLLAGKRLELLREVLPGFKRLAIMANAGSPNAAMELKEGEAELRTSLLIQSDAVREMRSRLHLRP